MNDVDFLLETHTYQYSVGCHTCLFNFPDKFGRKPVLVFSHIILFVIVMETAFSPNYYVLIIMRILTGAVIQVNIQI